MLVDTDSFLISDSILTLMLLQPVQRITKYPLLLNDLIKCVPGEDEDHQPLKTAMESLKEAVALIDVQADAWRRKRKTQQLWSRLGGPLPSWELNPQSCGVLSYGESRLKLIGIDERGIQWAKHYDFYLLDQGYILAVKPRKSKKSGPCQLKWWWKLVDTGELLWSLLEREDDEEEHSWIMKSRDADRQVFKFVAHDAKVKSEWIRRLVQFMGPPEVHPAKNPDMPEQDSAIMEFPGDNGSTTTGALSPQSGMHGLMNSPSQRRLAEARANLVEETYSSGLYAGQTTGVTTNTVQLPASSRVTHVETVINANGQLFTVGEDVETAAASAFNVLGLPAGIPRNAHSYDNLHDDVLRQYENEKASADGVFNKLFRRFAGGSGASRAKLQPA